VNPGIIKTDIFYKLGWDEEQVEAFYEHSKEMHALGRMGNVTEVAKCIAFLASEDASFITGVSIPIDGGRHIMSSI